MRTLRVTCVQRKTTKDIKVERGKYLVESLDDVRWLVLLSCEDDVDDLGDGGLDGQGVVLTPTAERPTQHRPTIGWERAFIDHRSFS